MVTTSRYLTSVSLAMGRLLPSLKCLQCLLVVLLLRESHADSNSTSTTVATNSTRPTVTMNSTSTTVATNSTSPTDDMITTSLTAAMNSPSPTVAMNSTQAAAPSDSGDTLALALTSSLVLVILGIVVVFAVIVQPHCCKKFRRLRPEVQLVEGSPRSGKAETVEQGEGSEHVYDVIRHSTIPDGIASEGSTDSLPVVEPNKYGGVYASPYEEVNFNTVGEYATLYATANTKNGAKKVGVGHNVGKVKRSAPSKEMVIQEAKKISSKDEASTTESEDNAEAKDINPQRGRCRRATQ